MQNDIKTRIKGLRNQYEQFYFNIINNTELPQNIRDHLITQYLTRYDELNNIEKSLISINT